GWRRRRQGRGAAGRTLARVAGDVAAARARAGPGDRQRGPLGARVGRRPASHHRRVRRAGRGRRAVGPGGRGRAGRRVVRERGDGRGGGGGGRGAERRPGGAGHVPLVLVAGATRTPG